MKRSSEPAGRALVTGASSGIGAAFADRLARDGYDLVLVARRRDRLEALSERFRREHGIAVELMPRDLTRSSDLRAVEARLSAEPPVTLLVNNAGFGGYMPFVTLDPDRAEELVRLQVVAVTRLTRAALPGMIARGAGAVINVSSRLAFTASMTAANLPRRATYAATKAYINAFTQLLSAELAGTGVRVQALCPGVVRTEFHALVGMDTSAFPPAIVSEPDQVVQVSLAALGRGEVMCLPGVKDPSLLAAVDESQRRLFEQGGRGPSGKPS